MSRGGGFELLESSEAAAEEIEAYYGSEHSLYSHLLLHVLAMGNAADAVELVCMANILPALKDVSIEEKERLASSVFVGMLIGDRSPLMNMNLKTDYADPSQAAVSVATSPTPWVARPVSSSLSLSTALQASSQHWPLPPPCSS